jgi:ABC-type phosphate transport system substrate-binding protein
MRSTFAKAAVLVVGAAAVTASLATPALADPPAGFTVAANDIVGVGSDTTQFLGNAQAFGRGAAAGYNATNPARKVTSWDAFKPGTNPPVVHDSITVRPGVSIQRPNGSSEGINELKKAGSQVDYARSSRGPRDGDQGLLFLPVALDGLKYATATTSSVPDGLSELDLRNIYLCNTPGIKPLLPQGGSGTRAYFLGQIGLQESDVAGKPCITEVQEHAFAPIAADSTAIAPFSTARFVTDGAGTGVKLNDNGFSKTRKVYNVVRYSEVDDGVQADLQAFFGDGSLGSGWVCGAAGAAARAAAGFIEAPTCGEVEFYTGG